MQNYAQNLNQQTSDQNEGNSAMQNHNQNFNRQSFDSQGKGGFSTFFLLKKVFLVPIQSAAG